MPLFHGWLGFKGLKHVGPSRGLAISGVITMETECSWVALSNLTESKVESFQAKVLSRSTYPLPRQAEYLSESVL